MSSISSANGSREKRIEFELDVEIARPRDAVVAYVGDLRRFSEWNSAVTSVVALGDGGPAAGGRYLMQRRLPTGPATNELEVVTWRPPDELVLRTVSGPTPFLYRYAFATTEVGTRVGLRAEVQLGGGAALLGPLAGQAVKRGVAANFATLRAILERSLGPSGPQRLEPLDDRQRLGGGRVDGRRHGQAANGRSGIADAGGLGW